MRLHAWYELRALCEAAAGYFDRHGKPLVAEQARELAREAELEARRIERATEAADRAAVG